MLMDRASERDLARIRKSPGVAATFDNTKTITQPYCQLALSRLELRVLKQGPDRSSTLATITRVYPRKGLERVCRRKAMTNQSKTMNVPSSTRPQSSASKRSLSHESSQSAKQPNRMERPIEQNNRVPAFLRQSKLGTGRLLHTRTCMIHQANIYYLDTRDL